MDFSVEFVQTPVCGTSLVSMFGKVVFEGFDGHPRVAKVFTDDAVVAGW